MVGHASELFANRFPFNQQSVLGRIRETIGLEGGKLWKAAFISLSQQLERHSLSVLKSQKTSQILSDFLVGSCLKSKDLKRGRVVPSDHLTH